VGTNLFLLLRCIFSTRAKSLSIMIMTGLQMLIFGCRTSRKPFPKFWRSWSTWCKGCHSWH